MPTTTHPRLVEALLDLGLEPDEIVASAQLRSDLDIDSAELVEVVSSILGEAPDGKALKGVRTVGELAAFLGS
jgi:acyl carrier protein